VLSLYPLLEPSTQPASEEEFGAMLARADVQARLRALRTNRLVAFTGGRTRAPAEGFVLCGYNGCLGYAWRSEGSRLDAALWDLEEARKSLALEASAQGKTRVPAFILPIPIPAQTLAQACEQLGHRIAAAITAPSMAPELPAPPAVPEVPAPGR